MSPCSGFGRSVPLPASSLRSGARQARPAAPNGRSRNPPLPFGIPRWSGSHAAYSGGRVGSRRPPYRDPATGRVLQTGVSIRGASRRYSTTGLSSGGRVGTRSEPYRDPAMGDFGWGLDTRACGALLDHRSKLRWSSRHAQRAVSRPSHGLRSARECRPSLAQPAERIAHRRLGRSGELGQRDGALEE